MRTFSNDDLENASARLAKARGAAPEAFGKMLATSQRKGDAGSALFWCAWTALLYRIAGGWGAVALLVVVLFFYTRASYLAAKAEARYFTETRPS